MHKETRPTNNDCNGSNKTLHATSKHEIMFDLTPIELLIKQLGTALFIRTRAHLQPFAKSPKGHLNKWAHIVDQLNLPIETDKIENTATLNHPYNANIASLSNDTKKYIGHSEYTAYTDGSKIDGKIGAGIIIYRQKEILYRQSYSLSSKQNLRPSDRRHLFSTETKYVTKPNILKSW